MARRNANRRKPFLMALWAFLLLVAVLPYLVPLDATDQDLSRSLHPPSRRFPFGTDELGRNVMTRIICGASISLSIAYLAVGGAFLVGGLTGLLAGYLGGLVDLLIMRVMDVLLAFPGFLLALAIAAIVGPGYWNVVIAVGVFSIPAFARIMRGTVISVREQEYVTAAVASGASTGRILLAHIMPNSVAPLLIVATNRIGSSILISGGLSFLGLGIQPPSPEWGAMLAAGRQYLWQAPYLVVFPGLAISLTAFFFNVLGEYSEKAVQGRK